MDGKVVLSEPPPAYRRPAPGRRMTAWLKMPLLAVVFLVAFVALPHRLPGFVASSATAAPSALPPGEFGWGDVRSSRNMSWTACYDGYECARLDVPMDWLDPTDEERVVLAVIRLPAVRRDDYRGAVFFNPGGPGGSGILSMRDHGKQLQTVVGDNHDIITFDPRGVGRSVPRIQCWEDYQRQHFWELQDVNNVDSYPGAAYDEFARAMAYSGVCETAIARSGMSRHLSTASHARDMLAILDQLGNDPSGAADQRPLSSPSPPQLLKYWGFSYGTVLGGTFAAMYPDRVGRLVSDGNVDYREWYRKTHVNFLRDTDKVMDAFYVLCHRAGPAACAFYAPSPAAIQRRLEGLLQRLRRYPVIVPAAVSSPSSSTDGDDDDGPGSIPGPDVPEIVTYAKLRRLLSTTLYRPHYSFTGFAEIAAGLDRGDGWPYYAHVAAARAPSAAVCAAESFLPTVPLPDRAKGNNDAFPAIMCADSPPESTDPAEFEKVAQELQEMSHAAGAVNALFRLACVGRTVRPKFRFAGPFTGHTAFPILYVNNMADNVTPLVSARNNSAGFPSSVILVQKSYGHTSLASPSTCTARHIRAYFQDGILPAPGTECLPDSLPFGLPSAQTASEDPELSAAIAELSKRASASAWTFGDRFV